MNQPVRNGQVLFPSDISEIYYDMNNVRRKIQGIVYVQSDSDLSGIVNVEEKLYFSIDSKTLFMYDRVNNEFVQVNRTGVITNLTSSQRAGLTSCSEDSIYIDSDTAIAYVGMNLSSNSLSSPSSSSVFWRRVGESISNYNGPVDIKTNNKNVISTDQNGNATIGSQYSTTDIKGDVLLNGNGVNTPNGFVALDEHGLIPESYLQKWKDDIEFSSDDISNSKFFVSEAIVGDFVVLDDEGRLVIPDEKQKVGGVEIDLTNFTVSGSWTISFIRYKTQDKESEVIYTESLTNGKYTINNCYIGTFSVIDADGNMVMPDQQQVGNDVIIDFNGFPDESFTIQYLHGSSIKRIGCGCSASRMSWFNSLSQEEWTFFINRAEEFFNESREEYSTSSSHGNNVLLSNSALRSASVSGSAPSSGGDEPIEQSNSHSYESNSNTNDDSNSSSDSGSSSSSDSDSSSSSDSVSTSSSDSVSLSSSDSEPPVPSNSTSESSSDSLSSDTSNSSSLSDYERLIRIPGVLAYQALPGDRIHYVYRQTDTYDPGTPITPSINPIDTEFIAEGRLFAPTTMSSFSCYGNSEVKINIAGDDTEETTGTATLTAEDGYWTFSCAKKQSNNGHNYLVTILDSTFYRFCNSYINNGEDSNSIHYQGYETSSNEAIFPSLTAERVVRNEETKLTTVYSLTIEIERITGYEFSGAGDAEFNGTYVVDEDAKHKTYGTILPVYSKYSSYLSQIENKSIYCFICYENGTWSAWTGELHNVYGSITPATYASENIDAESPWTCPDVPQIAPPPTVDAIFPSGYQSSYDPFLHKESV